MREHFSLLLLIWAFSCSVAAMSEDYDTAARLKRQIEGIKAQLASCTDRRVRVTAPLTQLLVRLQSSPTTSLDSAMEEQGWDDDRRIIDWLGKSHPCPPGLDLASPQPVDTIGTNHGDATDADEEEIQRRVESQRKRCERRSTPPVPGSLKKTFLICLKKILKEIC